MRKYFLIVLSVVIGLMMALTACSKTTSTSSSSGSGSSSKGGTILIGSNLPTSGDNATDGKDMENAIKMAIEEINSKGGVLGKKLQLQVEDTACDPQTATTAANKLVSSNVVAVVGGYCSGAELPASGVFENAKIPSIVPAANSSQLTAQGYSHLFLINGLVPDQAKTAADYFKSQNAKNIVIINDNSAYSKDLADKAKSAVEADGGKIIDFEAINPEEKDFGSLMTKLKSLKPDGLYFTGYYAAGGLMLKQFKQKEVPGLFMVGDGSYSPDIIKIAGADNADGLLVTATPQAKFIPGADQFVQNYKKEFNLDPGPFSALSYNGMNLLADAIKRAGSTDPEKISQALKATKEFKGIGETISFSDQNSLKESNFHVMKVTNGSFTLAK
jgi:branched-chain amino acid transport system substrate-binding protein